MRRPRRPALADIAAICGLSRATVARALSGKGYVEESKRAVIQKTADSLGYRTSALARALRTQRSRSIGVLIPDITNPIFPRIIKGIDDVLSEAGNTMLLCNTDEKPEKQLALAQSLIDRQVDGMILVSQTLASRAMRELLRAGPPCVFVNRRSGEPAHDYVGPDNAQAVDLLVRHLAELGHRRIGYISGPANSSSALERLAQFSRSMGELGLEAGDDFVFGGDYTAEAGRRGARHFLSMEPRPTAIIASNDICALGVIEHAQGLGVVIPRDLSVTGFDDVMGFDEFTENPVSFLSLTTISQPKRDLGAWAARMLLDRLSGRETGPGQTAVLGVELRRRGTTAAPSPELSPDVAAIARDGTPPARAGDMRRAHARSSAAGAPSPSGDDEAD